MCGSGLWIARRSKIKIAGQWLQREDIFAHELNEWRAKRVRDIMLQEEKNNKHQNSLRQAEAVVETITGLMHNL